MMNRRLFRVLPFLLPVLLCVLLCGSVSAEQAQRKLTVMVYMCGSNLESAYGSATADLEEMIAAGNDAGEVSVLVMAGGADMKKHAGYFQSDTTTIYEIGSGRIRSLWNSDGPLSMGEAETLKELIRCARENRPAEKYALILWDHGGGPLEGVCWDELFSMDQLGLKELVRALEESGLDGKLSWIGFDACLMSCAEVANAVSPYAEYMIASQEKEPAAGWNYRFITGLDQDRDGAETGRRIVDAYMEQANEDPNPLTLSCVDLRKLQEIIPALSAFFTNVSTDITPESYGDLSVRRLDSVGFGKAVRGAGNQSYDLVDLQDMVKKLGRNGNEQRVLSLLQEAVVCCRGTVSGATGLSVYHPFSNKKDYINKWNADYAGLPFCEGYQRYVSRFGSILTSDVLADWSGLQPETEPAASGQEQVFALQLTDMQRKTFAKGQLLVLAAYSEQNGIYTVAGARSDHTETQYSPVSVSSAKLDANGKLTAVLDTRTLYVTDENGQPVCGPLAYEMSDDGKTCHVHVTYKDQSGREDAADSLRALYSFEPGETGASLRMTGVMGYDSASGTYTPRVPVDEKEYTRLFFRTLGRKMPLELNSMPGFDEWEESELGTDLCIDLPLNWQLRFFDTQMSAVQLYGIFQITDNQQSAHSSRPVVIENPNLETVRIEPRVMENESYRLRFFLLRDTSPLDPGVNLVLEVTNLTKWDTWYFLSDIVINGKQTMLLEELAQGLLFLDPLAPQTARTAVIHLDRTALTNLESISEISMLFSRSSSFEQWVQDEIRLSTQQCGLKGIAQHADTVLSRTETNGQIWELLSLERTRTNDLKALLRVTNRTEEELWLNAKCALNDILVYDDSVGENSGYASIPAGAMGYVSVSITNRCHLIERFSIDGKAGSYHLLNADNQLECHGVTEIRSLRFVPLGEGETFDVAFTLDTPVPLGEGISEQPPGKPLLMGQLEARVERIFLADNGIGMRTVFINNSGQDLVVYCSSVVFNDRIRTDSLNSDYIPSFSVPAGGKTIICLGFSNDELLQAKEKIGKIGLTFVASNIPTSEAVIRIRQTDDGSRYLPEDCYDTVPGTYDPHELRFLSDRFEAGGHFAIQVKGGFSYYVNDAGALFWSDRPTDLKFSLKLTNLTNEIREFDSSHIVLNGTRVTNSQWIYSQKIQPGETVEKDVSVAMEDLRGLTDIHEISFSMWSRTETDSYSNRDNQVTVTFYTEADDLPAVNPTLPEPLAEGENDEITVQLLELSEDETGRMKLLMRFTGKKQEPRETNDYRILLNGLIFGEENGLRHYFSGVKSGQDLLLTVSSKNQFAIDNLYADVYQETDITGYPLDYILEDHALERRGVSAVTEIRLASGYFGPEDIILRPDTPIQLADIPATPDEERLRVLETPVEVLVNHVLVGENNVYVSVDLINRSDGRVQLYAESPSVNGEECAFRFDRTEQYFELLPHSRSTDCIMLKRNPESSLIRTNDLVQDISFVLKTDKYGGYKSSYVSVTVTLLREAPLGVMGGVVLAGNELAVNVNKAELLLWDSVSMQAETVAPVLLAPALDEKRTKAFAEGTATVCLKNEGAYWDLVEEEKEDGYYEHLTMLQPVCRTKLARDAQGAVVSKHSGLACVNSRGQTVQMLEYSGLNKETARLFRDLPETKKADCMLSVLYADVYLGREGYRRFRAENSEDAWPQPDCRLVAVNTLDLSDRKPVLLTADQHFFSNDFNAEMEFAQWDSREMLCVANQNIILPDQQNSLRSDGRQIIRLGELRYVRLDELEGAVVVRYDLTYEDGSTDVLYESYPTGQ